MENRIRLRRWKSKSRIRRIMTIAKLRMWLKKELENEYDKFLLQCFFESSTVDINAFNNLKLHGK